MKFKYFLILAITIGYSGVNINAFANPNSIALEGKYFINFATGTNWYKYDNSDARSELPDSFTQHMDSYDLTESEFDIINVNFALGYYISDKMSVRLNYSDGIELGFFDTLFGDENYDADMDLIELDIKYDIFNFSDNAALFVTGGLALHQVDATIYERVDSQRVTLASDSFSETGTKLGMGFQWNFSKRWGLKAGYSRLDYMSLSRRYAVFEFRF
ncbi:outer membrane protein [Aliikangiella sp. G2MR2-5]|uniref:outer membrane protein n=1 Tax=Aliikangiella sp. G2MR2-5 TaxID=2788943 RepID=UPI0018AAE316|nr:outer membrane beta-barrel protein [Aliikangiella sp. G2MR2-5]